MHFNTKGEKIPTQKEYPATRKAKAYYFMVERKRFFPKKTDLSFIKHQQVREVEQKLNNRSVRKINYQTPNQVLQGKLHLLMELTYLVINNLRNNA